MYIKLWIILINSRSLFLERDSAVEGFFFCNAFRFHYIGKLANIIPLKVCLSPKQSQWLNIGMVQYLFLMSL